MARYRRVSKSTVQRWFDLFALQPNRQRHFKISNAPFFVERVRGIVGLSLNPPTTPSCSRSMRKPRFKLFNELSPSSPWASTTSKVSFS